MIRFNANLFRIAFLCSSREETRFYLRGVYVEPHHEKGVTLTATNGTKLIVIHDASGQADESAIINLGDALKLCKPKRGERRDIVIATGGKDATICETRETGPRGASTLTDTPLGAAFSVKVEGSFPDYRRVIPRAFRNSMAPAFAAQYLSELCIVGTELAMHFHDFNSKTALSGDGRKDTMQIVAEDCDKPGGSPALVTWPAVPQALAILMPVNGGGAHALPAWYSPAPVAQAAE